MKTLLLLDKKAGLLRLVQLFKEKDELNIKDIKRKIPSTSYYRDVLARLVEINEILEEVDIEYFVKPIFIKDDGKIVSGLKKNPELSIQIKNKFVVIACEKN